MKLTEEELIKILCNPDETLDALDKDEKDLTKEEDELMDIVSKLLDI